MNFKSYKNAGEIAAQTKIKASVIARAIANPLKEKDPRAEAAEAHLDSIFLDKGSVRQTLLSELTAAAAALLAAQQHRTAVGGEDAATRRAANTALTAAERIERVLESRYRALPEEADAFAVQYKIQELFLFPTG